LAPSSVAAVYDRRSALIERNYKMGFDPFGVDGIFVGRFLSVGFTHG
jgi:hypothetical protein